MEARDITNTLSDSRVASSSRTDTVTPLEASQPPLPAEPHATAAYSYYPTGVSAQQLDSPARAINFSNALNYLDSVKAQFSQQPEVYNKFLDIMKDANNSRIATPGLIERRANLFHSRPALIQGFNIFLPAGYHMPETTDNPDPSVTTPAGITTEATNAA